MWYLIAYPSKSDSCSNKILGPTQQNNLLTRLSKNRLDQSKYRTQPLLNIGIFRLYKLLLPQYMLQFLIRLLARQFPNLPLQILNLVLGALADRSLSLTIIRPLFRKLIWSEVCDAARRRSSRRALAFFACIG